MFELWIVVTLAAAVVQNGRTILQKHMTARLSVLGSTYARFLYGVPLTVIFALAMEYLTAAPLPEPNGPFFAYAMVGAVAQVLGNIFFIALITFANFTISATYVKTETVLSALVSFVVIGDTLSSAGLLGIVITFLGCMMIAAARQRLSLGWLFYAMRDRAALMGLGVGALYAIGSTCYRAASLSLVGEHPELNAAFTLACVAFFQAASLGLWLAIRSPRVILEVLKAWRTAAWIGVTGVVASACWFTAFALQKTAYVLAVGQIEIVLAYLASRYIFRETATAKEFAGIATAVAGILIVVLAP
ncbi:MAG: DMT family transporter [Rhodobacteraceae bacterium]|nr:DMT family transporter [Paracoccaceae bacterium]